MYNDDYNQYKSRLSSKITQLSQYDPTAQKGLGNMHLSPLDIAIGHGYGNLLAHSNVEALYLRFADGLRDLFPTNCIYPIENIHVTDCVVVRSDKSPDHKFYETPPAGYLQTITQEVMNKISFREFTLKLINIFPRGILLWEPLENQSEIFNIRRQINNNMLAANTDGSLYYDTVNDLPVIPDIIHSTFFRVLNQNEWIQNFEKAQPLFNKFNDEILERDYTITVRETSFVKLAHNLNLPLDDEYNIKKLFDIEHITDIPAKV